MSARGQERRFEVPPVASGLAQSRDIARQARLVRLVPNCDIEDAGAYKQKAARRRPFNSILLIVDQTAINAGFDLRQ
jgi:hypothetical protein